MRMQFLLMAGVVAASPALGADIVVKATTIDERKAVIATVEPVHQLIARARIGGTVVSLKVKEGDLVAAGAEVAVVADQKLTLQVTALDSRILSSQASRDQAQVDYDRVAELQKRGTSSVAQLDQARTNLDVANRNLTAVKADRDVLVQQATEGAVLAPAAGRVLKVPVSEGSVIIGGETVATLAEDKFILRLQLPERHAAVMRAGDDVQIGSRAGLGASAGAEATRAGKVRIVYPEIQGGRVIADVEVDGLGDYFVGERTRVYVATGKRDAIMLPAAAIYRRASVSYVKLASGAEIVVQTGEVRGDQIEILAGLKDGDTVVRP